MKQEKKWTEHLENDVYIRLCNCSSRKSDILPLSQAKWAVLKNKDGFEKEDALISVLELLDCNSQMLELTTEEYEDILSRII